MKNNLPVILLKGTILIPQNELKLEFDDELAKNIIDEAEIFHDNRLLIVTKSSLEENIIIKDLPRIGTVAKITRKLELPNNLYSIDYHAFDTPTLQEIVMHANIEIINKDAFGKAADMEIPYVIAPRRPGDPDEVYANADKAKNVLGWEAQFGVERMCEDTWRWQKNNPNGYNK